MLWLALAAFVFRALAPAGFMPDANALQHGRLVLTFCTSGASALPPGLRDKTGDASGDNTGKDLAGGDSCPFGLLAAQAMIAPSATIVVFAAALRHVPPPLFFRALPPLPAHGPPLGSRAPPSHPG
ncbi:Protein of unknown function [Pollutimonas bauzanensis]|uniref:DUF2946 domain-containing protein n=2 Tax=Pollutimonas bauzanensis TaxID=658167 RepID=A0A1M5ZMK6_9BURK|nr:Protein of unknown function [Pollutimonas bauzanensis]